jgi:putative Holliday junction resolvase
VSRLLALDHGSRRIGIAIADTETGIAFARPALRRRGDAPDVAAIVELVRREGASRVIIGLPLNMDGSEGQQAARARGFGARLAAAGLPVSYQDERLTSWDARDRLVAAGQHPSRASGDVDSAAARLILQEYLDTHASTGQGTEA